MRRWLHPAAAAAGLEGEARRIRLSTNSRWWHLVVNVVAASFLTPPELRRWLYRRCGIETGADIKPACYFYGSDIRVGDGSSIHHRCYLDTRARIEIGDECALGMETMLITSSHEIGPPEHRFGAYKGLPIAIEDGCWIGSRVQIMPGVRVGAGCVVGGGSVVTRDCKANGFYAGVPARRVRDL